MNKSKNLSEKNGMWKGTKAGLDAIHIWVLRRKPKPKLCENCGKSEPKDLANISQKYKRNINDFEWLCRKCHMIKDGRLKDFISLPHSQNFPIKCGICKKLKRHKGLGFCDGCYSRMRYYVKRRTNHTKGRLYNLSFVEAVKYLS